MPLFYFLLLFLLSGSCKSSAPNCLSKSLCGEISISYPFSLYKPKDDTSESLNSSLYCGYPGLRIYCANNNTPIIYLGSDNYTITDINYINQTILLADTDVLTSSPSCPKPQHNVSLNPDLTWLNYTTPDVNLTFFFDCNPFAQTYDPISCLGVVNGKSYVFPSTAIDPQYYDVWVGMCKEVVVTPVVGSLVSTQLLNLSTEYGPLVKNGFQLEWYKNSENCSTCEHEGGQCGYNMTSESKFGNTCFCADGKCGERKNATFRKEIIAFVGASIGVCCLLAFCTFSFLFFRRYDRKVWLTGTGERNKTLKIEASLEDCITIVPKRYNFYEIRKMTRSFSENLGQGGYGTVYKGKLINGTLVAVKVFKDRESNGEEFINEVASIGRTSHVNIVRLLGFSIRGSKRALIYEFMPNGSLDKYLRESQKSTLSHIECERLFEITVGIARGLEYLHRGCNTRIVHFDIKPHNILLDQDYHPKISDFGLAKFCRPKESIISMTGMRGTIGYIAPEVFSRNFGTISSKSDVYSFGMMVFEMLGEKQNKPSEIQGCSETYFPDNIYNYLEENTISSVYGLLNVNEEIVTKLVIVGLWCIQLFPDSRPTMSRVLEMLEGNIEDLSIPQKLSLPLPPELVVDSSSTT